MGGENFFGGRLAWRKLMFRLVELVKQSKERICEATSVVAVYVHFRNGGVCGAPVVFRLYRPVQRRSVLSRIMLYVGIWRSYVCLILSVAGHK